MWAIAPMLNILLLLSSFLSNPTSLDWYYASCSPLSKARRKRTLLQENHTAPTQWLLVLRRPSLPGHRSGICLHTWASCPVPRQGTRRTSAPSPVIPTCALCRRSLMPLETDGPLLCMQCQQDEWIECIRMNGWLYDDGDSHHLWIWTSSVHHFQLPKTSIPLARTSTARDAANCDTKALVAPYITAKGLGMYPETEEVNTKHPLMFFWIIFFRKWCVTFTHAVLLHSMLASWESRLDWSKKPVTMKPALLNTISISISSVAYIDKHRSIKLDHNTIAHGKGTELL